ncbi:MAG: OmpA family protein [Pseudomonadota bacterium]
MKLRFIAVAIAAATLSTAAHADASDWYVTGGGSYINPDDSRSTDNDYTGYIGVGYWLRDKLGFELEYNTYSFDLVDNLGEVDIDGFVVSGKYHFLGNYDTSPYVGLGFGLLDSDSPFGGDSDAVVDVIGGIRYVLSPRLGLNGELRYRFDQDDDTLPQSDRYEDWMINFGLTYNFGDRVKPAPPAPEPVAAAAAPEPEAPRDSDGDGVIDARDACPDTPRGRPVEPNGCQKKVLVELKGVHFDFDKATLKPEAIAILNDGFKAMKEYGEVRVSIEGHTDSRGPEDYNKGLSDRRAKAVYEWFAEKGISPTRMRWEGFGESRPKASNDTPEGRADNRRVELRIID